MISGTALATLVRCATLLGAFGSTVALTAPSAAQARTTSHAMTTAGAAMNPSGGYSCATSGPDPIIRDAFTSGMGLPTEGYDYCHLSGSLVDNVADGATSATSSAMRAFNDGVANVAAGAVAAYDHIGAQSSATFTGYTSGLSYHSAEGAAIIDDALTFSGGAGVGYARFGFTVDGSLFANMGSEAQTYLAFSANGNSPQYAFVATVGGGVGRVTASYTPGFAGFTTDATSVSGTGIAFTYPISFTFGEPLDLEYGLRAYSYAAPFTGESMSNFLATAKLTSIDVTDSSGASVDFSTSSASGTLYDASGAHLQPIGPVPEPASWALMIGGLGLAGAALRSRRQAAPVA